MVSASAGRVALGAVLSVALSLIAFVSTGGFDSSITVSAADTWVEIALTLAGAGAVGAAILLGARGPAWGAASAGLFAVLTGLTALSILWSVQPDSSWQAANQTLAYLAVFAGAAALARLAPGHWPVVLGALAVLATVISGYALATKILPGSLAAADTQGRLQEPLGYWNATGAAAVLGLAPCLWVMGRRGSLAVLRGLAAAAGAVLASVVVLSYSRTAALAAILLVIAWLAYVPWRVRACAMLAPALAGAAVICAWALARPALSGDGQALGARTAAGHGFGVVVVLALLGTGGAAAAIARAGDRGRLSPRWRARAERGLVVVAALVPVLIVLALAVSSRGLTGQISHAWSSLTSVSNGVGNGASRFGALGSSRPLYWSEGIKVGEHALLEGVGALGYAVARTRYTTNPSSTEHAHSYVIQTFADLGLLGVAVSLALLGAWAIAAGRALAVRRRWSALDGPAGAERAGLTALALTALAFGLLSGTDWTWYFPAVTVPALLAAGWLAGRGPLGAPVDRGSLGAPVDRTRDRVSLLDRPARTASVAVLATLALLASWLIWQPLRAADAANAAITAAGAGHTGQAFDDARSAAAADPLALQPLFVLSSLYESIHNLPAARAQLTAAVALQPDNFESWLALGTYDLDHRRPRRALPSLRRAFALDPTVPVTGETLQQAEAAVHPG